MSLASAIDGAPASRSRRGCMVVSAKAGPCSGGVSTVRTRRGVLDLCFAHERLMREAGELAAPPPLIALVVQPPKPSPAAQPAPPPVPVEAATAAPADTEPPEKPMPPTKPPTPCLWPGCEYPASGIACDRDTGRLKKLGLVTVVRTADMADRPAIFADAARRWDAGERWPAAPEAEPEDAAVRALQAKAAEQATSDQPQITHSPECHRWHPDCAIARADDAETLRARVADLEKERTGLLAGGVAEVPALRQRVALLERRDPTEAEMLAALGAADEGFCGGTVRRCLGCRRPVFGGPTRCVGCATEGDETGDDAFRELAEIREAMGLSADADASKVMAEIERLAAMSVSKTKLRDAIARALGFEDGAGWSTDDELLADLRRRLAFDEAPVTVVEPIRAPVPVLDEEEVLRRADVVLRARETLTRELAAFRAVVQGRPA